MPKTTSERPASPGVLLSAVGACRYIASISIVTPAKAGAHPEISRWIPAFAGMTAGGHLRL